MPRFTLVTFPMDGANPGGDYFAELIRNGDFLHYPQYDFTTEEEVIEAQLNWAWNGLDERVVVEYEPQGNEYSLLGLRQLWGGTTKFRYPEPPRFVLDAEGEMLSNQNTLFIAIVREVLREHLPAILPEILPEILEEFLEERAPEQRINTTQSTHTESVHKTVTKSIQELNARYLSVRVKDNMAAIKAFANDITAENFPEISDIVREAAKRFIHRMDMLYEKQEPGSGISIKRILALVWAGVKDNTSGARLADEHVALEKFIKHLYEIQRGNNINANGDDDGNVDDQSICVGGTINKLVDVLNGGLHQDVFILYVTQETAGEKLKALIKEGTVAFVKNAENKAELMEEINKLPIESGSDKSWDIPEVILEKIKDSVKKKFYREFKNSLVPAVLNEVFEGVYGYVLLDQKDLNKITSSSPCAIDEDVSVSEQDEIEFPTRSPILDENSLVIKRFLMAIDELERYGKARLLSDPAKHNTAVDLADELRGMLRSFIYVNTDPNTLPRNFHEFKQRFSETLHRDNELFSEHRDYNRIILANILIALTGIGILILGGKMTYSFMTTGRVEGFFAKTKGQDMVDNITEDLNNLKFQMP